MTYDQPGNSGEPPPGAVLSKQLIFDLSTNPPDDRGPLIEPLEERNLKPAAYDMRIAADGMVKPDGDFLLPGSDRRHVGALIIQPGETAFVSTYEQLDVPPGIVGNISIKGTMARAGIVLLTGSIVDSGWRRQEPEAGSDTAPPTSRDGRLHFALANLGQDPVAIYPESTKVVTIQFLYVAGDAEEITTSDADDIWQGRPKHGLGFVEQLRKVRADVGELSRSVERQQRATEVITVAGFFVLMVTILGVALASILSAASDEKLVRQVKNAIPNDGDERIFVLTTIVAAAWVFYSVSRLAATRRRTNAPPPAVDPEQRREREAYVELRWRRVRSQVFTGCAAVGIAVGLAEFGTVTGVPTEWWWSVPIVAILLVAATTALMHHLWDPITDEEIRSKAAALRIVDEPASASDGEAPSGASDADADASGPAQAAPDARPPDQPPSAPNA